VILDVRKSGQRVKIVLSRTHPDFIRRLFEQEIPELAEHIIEIRSVAREAGYRAKVAVSSIDSKVDCVGACVGVRGSRIKNVLDELGGERIDIIRYNESLQVMIPNALAPAQIEEVQIYPRIGRAIVLVREDQLSLAIGKRGQNVRLASKLTGIDIEIMTFDELTEEIEKAESNFSSLPHVSEEAIEGLIEEGVLSFDDLSVMEPERVMEIFSLEEDQAMEVIEYAEEAAENAPQETSSRSSIVSNPAPAGAGSVDQLLGGASESASREPRVPTVDELFGDVVPEPEPRKITAEELFRESSVEAAEDGQADEETGEPADADESSKSADAEQGA
jgi:N utilization substance protein A